MKDVTNALEFAGVSRETRAALAEAENEKQAKEYALICIALFDDRHEYVD